MADYRVYVPSGVLNELWEQTHGEAPPYPAFANACAQWGFDRGVEACCNWVANADGHAGFDDEDGMSLSNKLRAAMSPKPPSLAEQGLKALGPSHFRTLSVAEQEDIRAALERLKELEAQQ
jgi:hypothetical protein